MGDEPYFIDSITKTAIDTIIPDEHKTLNQAIFYGRDSDVNIILNELKQYPFGFQKRLIIIKEAQHLKNIEYLENYFERPQLSSILIVCYKNKKLDKRKKIYKILESNHVIFNSQKIYDNKIADWIKKYLETKNIVIEAKACNTLIEYIGNDLSKISNEINKICSHSSIKKITNDLINDQIGISKEFNLFELQKSLGKKDKNKALIIINYFSANPNKNPSVLILSSIFNYYNKLLLIKQIKNKSMLAKKIGVNTYFLNDYIQASKRYEFKELLNIINLICEYDLRIKGINNNKISQSDLLKELIAKILYCNNILIQNKEQTY